MTNGEKFKQTFPNCQIDMGEIYVYAWLPNHDAVDIPHEWWDEEYKEPTSNNDSAVDCIDRANVIDRVITYFDHIKKDNDEWSKGYDAGMEDAISVIKSMPSVTPQLSSELEKNSKLEKIRVEIERQERWLMDTGYNACSVDIAFDAIKSVVAEMEDT